MRWAAIILLSGCSSILGIDNFKLGDAGGGGDGDPEGITPDVPSNCLGASGFAVCLQQMPSMPFDYNATMPAIDTSVGSAACLPMQPTGWTAQPQPDACFIAATTISIGASMRVTGARPLVLVATDTITIPSGGAIDAAGHRGATIPGPGAPSSDCIAQQPPPEENGGGNTGHGGGAGATFGTRGAPGGAGGAGQNQPGQPSGTILVPTKLRGGCNGGFGGRGQSASNPPGGLGGGVVYLVAKNRILIDGQINVSGAGGSAGAPSSGGGGGGAGGMVMLHAAMLSGGGIIIANGGGGAGGSGSGTGTPGFDPSPTAPTSPAPGGGGAGAPGGSGFAGQNQANGGQTAGANNTGGGGGGGGGGYIRSNMALPAALQTSPAPSVGP